MKRLLSLWHVPAVLGLALALQGIVAVPCFAIGWKHGGVMVSSAPAVAYAPVAPVAPVYMMTAPVVPMTLVAPSYVAPMVPAPMMAAPAYYSVPAYHYPYPAAAPAAVAPTYYTPPAPAASAPQPTSLPVAPMSFLANFDPDLPMVPGVAGYDPAMPQVRGSRIFQGLRNALIGDRNMLFSSLLQLGVKLFAHEFGFSPNTQDVTVLTGLITKLLDEFNGSGTSNPPPVPGPGTSNPPPGPGTSNPPPGPGTSIQAGQGLVITVILPANARITVQQAGQEGQSSSANPNPSSNANRPGTNPTGTSGGPGNP